MTAVYENYAEFGNRKFVARFDGDARCTVAELIARGATFPGSCAGWRLVEPYGDGIKYTPTEAGVVHTIGYQRVLGTIDVVSIGLPDVFGRTGGQRITRIYVFA